MTADACLPSGYLAIIFIILSSFSAENEKFSGCTIHYVNSRLDSGKIILQKKVKIFKNDTEYKLAKRVLKQEHLLYPKALKKVLINL